MIRIMILSTQQHTAKVSAMYMACCTCI